MQKTNVILQTNDIRKIVVRTAELDSRQTCAIRREQTGNIVADSKNEYHMISISAVKCDLKNVIKLVHKNILFNILTIGRAKLWAVCRGVGQTCKTYYVCG